MIGRPTYPLTYDVTRRILPSGWTKSAFTLLLGPGLNPESSDLVIMARLLGVSHAELVGRILSAALSRCHFG
jgi:hypothetical protein